MRRRSRPVSSRCFRFALAWLALATCGAAPAAGQGPLIVLSRDQPEYAEVAAGIQQSLAKQGTPARDSTIVTAADLERRLAEGREIRWPDLIVTVGTQAARLTARLNPPAPVLHTLLPRQAFDEMAKEYRLNASGAGRRHSAIFLDQPLSRQLDLMQAALPELRRVAVLLGPATAQLESELASAARQRNLTVSPKRLADAGGLIPALEDLLEGSDALLALPDPLVYQSRTIHYLLITTYRQKVPVVGFSKALVEAGALLGVYSTPAQIGRQAGEIAQQALSHPGRALPPPRHPKYFTIAVNRRVAASLGIPIEDEQTLLDRLLGHTE